MNPWRQWTFDRLLLVASAHSIPQSSVYAAGSLNSVPAARPFIVYRMVDETVAMRDDSRPTAHRELMQVWVHDEPGSYDNLDDILNSVCDELTGPADEEGLIACEYNGKGPETQDDNLQTITRWASFTLVSRKVAV